MVAPPNPYRCPPGPYERVSMVAHLLKEINPTAKILIADPKPKFSKQGLFEEGWQKHYGGMIERIGPDFGGDNVSVDAGAMTVTIDGSVEKVDGFVSKTGEDAALRKATYEESIGWYSGITSDMFG